MSNMPRQYYNELTITMRWECWIFRLWRKFWSCFTRWKVWRWIWATNSKEKKEKFVKSIIIETTLNIMRDSYLVFRLIGGADAAFVWNLAELTLGKSWSSDLVAGSGVVGPLPSLVDVPLLLLPPPSRSCEFRRIIIVLVLGNLRLCSLRPSSLYMLQAFNFLIAMCVRLSRGGTGGGDTSRGGNAGASAACFVCASRTASDSGFSRLRGGNGGGGMWQKLWALGTFTCGETGIGSNSCKSGVTFECFGLIAVALLLLADAPSS